jgi:hypothetical protein
MRRGQTMVRSLGRRHHVKGVMRLESYVMVE